MTVLMYEEVTFEEALAVSELAEKAVATALRMEDFGEDCEVSVTITDSPGIRSMNGEFRGIDDATDVLSFPMLSFEAVGAGYDSIVAGCQEHNPETGELILGDIVINRDRVISQAEEFGHSLEREYVFLIVHSMLHLMGYDHMRTEDESLMRRQQRIIMEEMGLTR